MAKSNKKSKPLEKGGKKCYTDVNTAKRVEGGMKSRGKRVKREGKCITIL